MARYQCVALKTCCYRSHAVVKDWLSYAAEQRRKVSIVIPSSPSTDLQAIISEASVISLETVSECRAVAHH
jgi:glycerol dehydrogenase-like iron-containing ADH family enzyme